MNNTLASLKTQPADYAQLHMTPEIQPWEDGLRTGEKRGEYEWWYFDAKFTDGSSLVIIFYTNPITALQSGRHPSLSFTWTLQDGTRIEDSGDYEGSDYSFAKDHCKVVMGKSCFEGDLHTYHIHYERGGIQADITLTGNIAPWRPGTGHIFFGEDKFFAWLPSVPEGTVTADIHANGQDFSLQGSGYHDHNWGNTGMYFLMHHWYWGRAKIGDYQAITSYITAGKKYGYEHFMIFLLAKDGKVIGADGAKASFLQEDPLFSKKTHKHFHKTLHYDYNCGKDRYKVTYSMENLVEEFSLTDSASVDAAKTNALMRFSLRFIGLDPSYIRMTGTAKVEHFMGDTLVDTAKSPALWEMMYFGKDADV